MADEETIKVYAMRAGDYANMVAKTKPDVDLSAFMAMLPPGGRVLDFGCGPGQSAAKMRAAGFEAEGLDASPEFVELARKADVPTRLGTFEDLDDAGAWDGIWANFSLLHAPKADMPAHLDRIHKALKPGGAFHIGTKLGEGEERDKIGRFYAFYEEEELVGLLEAAGFSIVRRNYGSEPGLSGEEHPWIILQATRTT